jgi:hypothetical protein
MLLPSAYGHGREVEQRLRAANAVSLVSRDRDEAVLRGVLHAEVDERHRGSKAFE